MDGKFAKLSPFQVDSDKIPPLSAEDFAPAAEEEKAAMVEKHKSVSYWRDAWRRFRANTVSMVALAVFTLCLLFAFLGPKLIPYSYGDQYRSSQKLAPFAYSKGEETIRSISGSCDGFYATALQRGSITALSKGDYYIRCKGRTYAFNLPKAVEKCRSSCVEITPVPPKKSISDAEVLVVGGRGLKKESDLEMIRELAALLGGDWATTRPLVEKGWSTNDRQIGLKRLCAVHLNDSKNACGSRKDRHAKLGEGLIGFDALLRVTRHPALSHLPFVLETPNELEGYAREIRCIREGRPDAGSDLGL